MDKVSFSSTLTSIAQSLVNLTRRWRRRVTIAPRRRGERGWGAAGWSGGKLLITRGGTLLLGGRGRRGLITAMEIEGVKGRQSWREKDSSAILPW